MSDDGKYGLNVFVQEPSPELIYSAKRPMVLVCPGGGYWALSDREADPIAIAFANEGFQVAVLRYPVAEDCSWPNPINCLSRAMKIIRENAAELYTDPDSIAVCGFSAGGHLAASLGVLWNNPEVTEVSGCANGENKPNALMLIYPVISPEYGHTGSTDNLLKDVKDPAERARLQELVSLDRQIGPHTPPSFIMSTFDDTVVPAENSIKFALGLNRLHIPYELHVYKECEHGCALADWRTNNDPRLVKPSSNTWVPLCADFLRGVFRYPV